jgi:hemerythrin
MQKEWSSGLETGIPEIDSGNKRFVEHINNLSKAKESVDKVELEHVIDALLDHVCNQFLLEEHMMKEAGYQHAVAHEKVHELFAKKVADFRGRIQAGEAPFDELIEMLDKWIEGHVRNEDQLYADTVLVKIEQEGGQSWVKGIMTKLFG